MIAGLLLLGAGGCALGALAFAACAGGFLDREDREEAGLAALLAFGLAVAALSLALCAGAVWP